jgi:hypothetical protein
MRKPKTRGREIVGIDATAGISNARLQAGVAAWRMKENREHEA